MIYRKRVKKTGYSISLTSQFLKVELHKHVWYFKFLGVGKPFHHTLKRITDNQGLETVTHIRLRYRRTVNKYIDNYLFGRLWLSTMFYSNN